MGQVTAKIEAILPATPDEAVAALSDYRTVRPAVLPEQYTDYAVQEGGVGEGTVVAWRLHATKKRVRDVVADVTVTPFSVTETDRNSSMVTVFKVSPAGNGSMVTATTTWQGASGIGGFFERTFAPAGVCRIHGTLLANLAARLGS